MSADSHCIICEARVVPTASSSTTKPELTRHLDAYFCLRYVLDMPEERITVLLKQYPDFGLWIRICERCNGNLLEFKAADQHRRDCLKKLLESKACVTQRRAGLRSASKEGSVSQKIRDCVNKYINEKVTVKESPFLEGDRKAEEMAAALKAPSPRVQTVAGSQSARQTNDGQTLPVPGTSRNPFAWTPRPKKSQFRSRRF